MKFKTLKPVLCFFGIALFVSSNLQGQSTKQEHEETPTPSVEKLFAKMDVNEDGKLSKGEVRGPLKADFAKIDSNSDGFITEEELLNSPKQTKKAIPKNGRP